LAAYAVYHAMTSEEERKVYRTKLFKQIDERKNAIVEKNKDSPFDLKLKATGWPINAYKFQIYRWAFLVVTTIYYVLTPLMVSHTVNRSVLAMPLLFFVLTEPRIKFSVVSKLVDFLINVKRRKKVLELFTLFDILKADLSTLTSEQSVNIYTILKDSLSMFEHINGSVSRFLSVWKTDPNKAKTVFVSDIGGESAGVLGEILFKLDKTSKNEALNIIESEASVFSFAYYEREVQSGIKRKNLFFFLFSSNILLIIAWLFIIVFTMFMNSMNQNNFF